MPAGGCEIDRSLYTRIYDEVRQEVVTNNPTFSPRETSLLTKQIFRIRHYEPDMKSVKSYENSEAKEYVAGTFTMYGGEIIYDQSGRSANELQERARKYKPQEYSEGVHKTILLAQAALNAGATEVSHISYYGDGEGEKIRDEVILRREGDKGKIIVRKIADKGEYHTTDSARAAMREMHQGKVEITLAPGVFIFSDQALPKPAADSLRRRSLDVISKSQTKEVCTICTTPLESMLKDGEIVVRKVAGDSVTTVVTAGAFTLEKLKEKRRVKTPEVKLQKPIIKTQLGERVFGQRQDERVISVLPSSVTATKEKKRQSTTTVVPRKEQSSPVLGKEKKILRQFIRRRRQEVRGLQKTITLAVRSGVGIGIAVWGIEFMSKEVVRRQRQFFKDIKRQRQEKRLKPETVRRRKEYRLRKIRRAKEAVVVIKSTPSREKLLARSEQKSFRTVDKKERQRERALRRSIRRWRRTGVDSDPRRAAVQEDIKKLPLTKSKESLAPRVAKKERLARKKKTILTLRIVWNWWLLLSERNKFRRPQIPLSSSERSKSPPVTRLEAKTWLMLSIIWYLVMLREQGKGQRPKKRSKTSVQKVVPAVSPILPVQGVIFALGS